jgi:peroxiredoxin
MKIAIVFAFLLLCFSVSALAQHEYAPLQEKEVKYKNWNYKRLDGSKEINLREYAKDKKLVLVVYFAPWCPNWRLQAPFAQKLHEKYQASGLGVIGVGEYDTTEKMRASVESFKITFPVVYESDSTAAKQTTPHYEYRKATGDTRNWGSPWSIFLIPADLKKQGETLTEKTFVVNGELIEAETESFIREKLGLSKDEKKAETAQSKTTEVCDPSAAVTFKKP